MCGEVKSPDLQQGCYCYLTSGGIAWDRFALPATADAFFLKAKLC